MTDRERLIELIGNKPFTAEYENYNSLEWAEHFADYLLANGVIVSPCKVGAKVWEIEYEIGSYELWEARPLETEVKAICILTENDYYPIDRVGKVVFFTKEEALKECNNGTT